MLFTNRLYLFFFSIHLLFTNGLRAWTIENIVNNTASPIQVVFSQGDKAIITATIPPQSILPFFQKWSAPPLYAAAEPLKADTASV